MLGVSKWICFRLLVCWGVMEIKCVLFWYLMLFKINGVDVDEIILVVVFLIGFFRGFVIVDDDDGVSVFLCLVRRLVICCFSFSYWLDSVLLCCFSILMCCVIDVICCCNWVCCWFIFCWFFVSVCVNCFWVIVLINGFGGFVCCWCVFILVMCCLNWVCCCVNVCYCCFNVVEDCIRCSCCVYKKVDDVLSMIIIVRYFVLCRGNGLFVFLGFFFFIMMCFFLMLVWWGNERVMF